MTRRERLEEWAEVVEKHYYTKNQPVADELRALWAVVDAAEAFVTRMQYTGPMKDAIDAYHEGDQ